jgi:hypothetical protein
MLKRLKKLHVSTERLTWIATRTAVERLLLEEVRPVLQALLHKETRLVEVRDANVRAPIQDNDFRLRKRSPGNFLI